MKLFSAICLLFTMLFLRIEAVSQSITINSPDKRIAVKVFMENERIYYEAGIDGKKVLLPSKLGLVREDEDFSTGMKWKKASGIRKYTTGYTLLTAKKREIAYTYTTSTISLQSKGKKKMNIEFRVSNDGLAFQYQFTEKPRKIRIIRKIKEEVTSFNFGKEARTWLQPKAEAQSGWEHVNPCYEENYLMDQPAGKSSPSTNGFIYPALFKSNDTWVLITEAGLERNYCGTSLRQHAPDGEYTIGFPHPAEGMKGKAVNPESLLPWSTPWRVVAIGSLGTIIESTLGTDLAKPSAWSDKKYNPGKASWSWAIKHDEAITYAESKQFIDYSADMKWRYSLIDVNWDTRIGYDSIKMLCDYARTKNVEVLLWYNSAGDWNTTPYHPRSMLLTKESRLKEFKRIKDIGVSGVKIDFFAGDGQSMIAYYLDILKDADDVGLLVNFHGATIPRGWHSTYPNLMTMEAVKGFEMITFSQKTADEAPAHCAMLPFTRNAFDPMDFTPMSLYKIPGITRRTTVGYELALSVLFISGIQHYAERPEGMATVPGYIKKLLQEIPSVWEDVKFIDGYPGKYVVIARKSGNKWYIAGINGETGHRKISVDLSFAGNRKNANYFTDGQDNTSLKLDIKNISDGKPVEIDMQPYGGFVMVLD